MRVTGADGVLTRMDADEARPRAGAVASCLRSLLATTTASSYPDVLRERLAGAAIGLEILGEGGGQPAGEIALATLNAVSASVHRDRYGGDVVDGPAAATPARVAGSIDRVLGIDRGGPRPALSRSTTQLVRRMRAERDEHGRPRYTLAYIGQVVGCSVSTVYRCLTGRSVYGYQDRDVQGGENGAHVERDIGAGDHALGENGAKVGMI
jgi:hypothetical protein